MPTLQIFAATTIPCCCIIFFSIRKKRECCSKEQSCSEDDKDRLIRLDGEPANEKGDDIAGSRAFSCFSCDERAVELMPVELPLLEDDSCDKESGLVNLGAPKMRSDGSLSQYSTSLVLV